MQHLTPRQLQILSLYSQGKSPSVVLFLSPRTVNNHMANIHEALSTQSVAQSITVAIARGWLEVDPVLEHALPVERDLVAA